MRRRWVFVGMGGLAAAMLAMILLGQTAAPLQAREIAEGRKIVNLAGIVRRSDAALAVIAELRGVASLLNGRGIVAELLPNGESRKIAEIEYLGVLGSGLEGDELCAWGPVVWSRHSALLGKIADLHAIKVGNGPVNPTMFRFRDDWNEEYDGNEEYVGDTIFNIIEEPR